MTNHSKDTINFDLRDRTAEMLFLRKYVEFTEVDELDDTERSSNGFGSTGK